MTIIFRNFLFDTAKATLQNDATTTLQLTEVAEALKSLLSIAAIRIDGHSDKQMFKDVSRAESDRLNQTLSEQRAATIKQEDARALYQQLTRLAKSKYNNIHATLLTDGAKPPTANNIRDALDTLLNAKENDTTVIFVAGHGENGDDGYYFLSKDASQRNGRWRSSTVLCWLDFQDVIQNTKGKRLLLLDTCHSGAAIQPSLLKKVVDDRIYVMVATDYQNLAQETDKLRHGVFAYSLLEGLRGEADRNALSDNKIQLQELAAYVSGKVRQLTDNMQQPVLHIPNGFKDFDLVQLD
jgi:uncharacterized caspase-like protein